MAVCDYIAIWLAEYAAYGIRACLLPNSYFHLSWLSIHVIVPAVYLLFLKLHHLYTRCMQFWQIISNLFKATFYSIALLIFFIYIAQTAASTSRLFVGLLAMSSFIFLVIERYVVKRILTLVRKMLQLFGLYHGRRKDGSPHA